jgi:ribose-phosphate pyrophosphokinase
VAATHALLAANAREKLSDPAVREVLVTDSVDMRERDWPQLRTVSIAPLLAAALEPPMAGGTYSNTQRQAARHRKEKI